VKAPGNCVSVDQMESHTARFLAQLKGRLTKARHSVATVIVDHYSRLGCVHIQRDTTSKETLKAKRAFELFARDRGVRIKHYHAGNGRFVDNMWKNALEEDNQGITYCGVNAHWQNGVAEPRIRDLKEQARTMILHAEHHWPEATSTSLWPYALRTACAVFNNAPTLKGKHKDDTPLELFTGTRISAEVRNHHTFGCPAYILANELQENKSLPAWLSRARVGVNLGISPTHARSVALVLSLKTGLASPQFHVKHDDLFETTQRKKGGFRMPRSHRQSLLGSAKPEAMVPAVNKAEEQRSEHRQRVGGQLSGRNNQDTTIDQEGDEVEGSDGFEGDVESIGEEDEPPGDPDSISTTEEDLATNRSSGNGQTSEMEHQPQLQQSHPLEETRGRTARSGRRIKVTERARESNLQRGKQWVAWIAGLVNQPALPEEDEIYEIFAHQEYNIQDRASDPIAFTATSDPDPMRWHQAMQAPDREDFLKAAKTEVKSHVDN
jgi:hypothetical protein